MNRVINDPDRVVEDMLAGVVAAHPQLRVLPHNSRVVTRALGTPRNRVGLVSGGGSGHEPAFLGYLGPGLLDAVAVGEVFSSPTARSFADAFVAADGGQGVACLYGNYSGDNMNVKMAVQLAAARGTRVVCVAANDDAASAPPSAMDLRRGVAGEILMWKTAAACALRGGDLDAVADAARHCISQTRSVGIGLSACTIPANGQPNFHIPEGKMEVGIGHHGEHGVSVHEVLPAAGMAQMMLDMVVPELALARGDEVAVLLSGLGATPLMEQYILYAEVARRLAGGGVDVVFARVGNLFTSLEMMGVTLTVTRLDSALRQWLLDPCDSPGLHVGAQP